MGYPVAPAWSQRKRARDGPVVDRSGRWRHSGCWLRDHLSADLRQSPVVRW